ncbi:uncharacterized protein LOC120737666 [Simochromis diagramma]|uniref:uncharacterized protein LOC120737666 n=1 Tax=Simochromis diagramma TaxID=43689 RepID=UPI001A7E4D4F|nr:uncharacterized protein LOC120737666 [Simochromis diagramma]
MTAAFYPQIEGSCDRVCVCYFHKEKNGTLLKRHVPREHLDFFRCARDCWFILQCGVFGTSPAPHPGAIRRRVFKPALPASHHQFVVATSVPTRFSSCQCWSELLQLLQSDIKLRTSILTSYSPDCPSVYRHSSETGYPPSLCSPYWTLAETPTPGFTTCSLQSSQLLCSLCTPRVLVFLRFQPSSAVGPLFKFQFLTMFLFKFPIIK